MKLLIILLLVGSLSSNSYGSSNGSTKNANDADNSSDSENDFINLYLIESKILEWIEDGKQNFISSEHEKLQLLENGELGRSNSLVWKGIYSNDQKRIVNQTVAMKLFLKHKNFDKEFAIFNALNAANDPEIEKYGIPRVYYHGPICDGTYSGIAMTIFEESLVFYYARNGRNLSDLTILSFLRDAIVALKYLNSKHVLHNDIKPQNLFVRGEKLFICDFDLSTLDGAQSDGGSPVFASARFFGNKPRNAMDDLESLVYSIWWVSGVDMIRFDFFNETEGVLMNRCTKEKAVARVLEKIKHYQNPEVYEVMKFICVDEMLSDRPVPAYDAIIAKLNKAILHLKKSSK